MTGASRIPRAPLALGLAGLVPFWVLAAAIGLGAGGWPPSTLAFALATYGAVIVSFLGGIRWGLATASTDQDGVAEQYLIAVVPSLLAWATLALPASAGLAALGLVALALGGLDQSLVRGRLAPPWFGRLRLILSAGAGLALLIGAFLAAGRA